MKAPFEYWTQIQSFLKEVYRVLRITKKPTKEEYKAVVKVTGLGILVIGAIGFIIATIGLLVGIWTHKFLSYGQLQIGKSKS